MSQDDANPSTNTGERICVLDTETTGLKKDIDKVIEIGVLEMIDRVPTGRQLHHYINPQKRIDQGAIAVHGITNDFLKDKPVFADVAAEIKAFLQGSTVVIHNAPFDVGFIDAEFNRLGDGWAMAHDCEILDTLVMARRQFPGASNSLDALCTRFKVDSTQRQLHGALLDAQLLQQVYLAMTRRQYAFAMQGNDSSQSAKSDSQVSWAALADQLVTQVAPEADADLHQKYVTFLTEKVGHAVWASEDVVSADGDRDS